MSPSFSYPRLASFSLRLAVAAAVALSLDRAARAQSCSPTLIQAATYEYQDTTLNCEISGFYPYVIAPNDTTSPPTKYATESCSGSAHLNGNGTGGCWSAVLYTYSGAWTFDKNDDGSNPGKGYTYNGANCSTPLNGTVTGGGDLSPLPPVTTTATAQTWSDNSPDPGIPDPGGAIWWGGSFTQQLSDPFTADDAIARAQNNKVVSSGDPLQTYTNYDPLTNAAAATALRTTPVTFKIQTVQFRAQFSQDAIKCPGTYQIAYYYYRWKIGDPMPATPDQNLTQTETVTFKDPPYFAPQSGYRQYPTTGQGEYCQLAYVKAIKICDAGSPGDGKDSLSSVEVNLNLGHRNGNQAAGVLGVEADQITAALYSPSALNAIVPTAPDVIVVRDSNQAVRQVDAPQCLADVETIDSATYEVRFYYASQVGAQDPGTHLFALSGSPYVVFQFKNPDAGTATNRLQVTETRGSQIKTTLYTDSGAGMAMSLASGLRTESLAISVNGADTTRTRTITDASNNVSSVTQETWHAFAWGQNLTKEVKDPAGAALTTTYTYDYTDSTTANDYGLLKQKLDPFGRWEAYSYDSAKRLTKTVAQFLDSAVGSADSSNRVTTVTYGTLADQDGDGTPETLVTTVQTLLGQEISRSYEIIYSQLGTADGQSVETRAEIQCTTPGAAWNDATNLVTKTRRVKGGDWDGRPVSQLNPDNTLSTYDYAFGPTTVTTTSYTGAASGDGTTVTAGTETVTVETLDGRMLSTDTYDFPSGLHLTSQVTTQQDSLGRPIRYDFLDGTFEMLSYACCGIDSDTDREGIATNYDYNALGFVDQETRAGISKKSSLDPEGRVLSVTRVGTDNSQIVTETNQYDLAGRRFWAQDALGRETTFRETINGAGHRVETTTYPDGGTRVEIYARDGSLLSVTGTAAPQQLSYNYGVDANGVYTQEVHLGSTGQTTEWVKTYNDFAGRPYLKVYADGATEQSSYNNLGQLVKQVDADGVTTLYAYNARGEQEYTAIDVDQNGSIDFTGTDCITQTHRDVLTDHGVTVQRTTTTVWTTNNAGTTQTVSVNETTPEGRQIWQTTYGLTTQTQITYGGNGARTETTTAPDNTVTVRQYQNDLLMSQTVTSAGTQLSGLTYFYDADNRLQTATDARTGATTYSYFNDDQIHTVTTPDPDPARSGPGYDPQTTTFGYDDAGRQDQVTQPDGGIVTTVYYPTGLVQKVSGARTYPVQYTYDTQGRVKTLTTWQNYAGPTGAAVTTWNYDPQRGWLTSKQYNDGNGPSYTYYPSGRLHTRTWARTVNSAALVATYNYTNAGDLWTISYSDGTTPNVSLTYDRQDRLSTTTDAAGFCTWAYDPVSGQLQNETYGSGLLNGLSVGRNFDGLNRLSGLSIASASSVLNSVTYAYDSASRLQTVTSGALTATYGYVPDSNLVQTLTLQNGGSTRLMTTKTYDNLNRLASVSSSAAATSAFNYDYNSANQRVKATREDGSYWSYGYDSLGQLSSAQKYLAGGTPVPGLSYGWSYDTIGNRQTATTNSRPANYSANRLNQYSQRDVPGAVDVTGTANSSATVLVNQQAAQRQGGFFWGTATASNSTAPVWLPIALSGAAATGSNNQYAVSTQNYHAFLAKNPEIFSYDLDGNLTADGRWAYTWDAENRLIAMQTNSAAIAAGAPNQRLEFAYDYMGRRIQKVVKNWNATMSSYQVASDTRFAYDGWNLIGEFDAMNNNAVIRNYVWGLDLSGSLQGAGGVDGLLFSTVNGQPITVNYAIAYDGNGNIISLVNAADGSDAADFEYDLFGNVVKATGAAANAQPFGFSTKYTDSETGLFYYGQRYYQPGTGRWLNRDRIEEQGGLNIYGFLSNGTPNAIDPLGLQVQMQGPFGPMQAYEPSLPGWSPPNYAHSFAVASDSVINAVRRLLPGAEGSFTPISTTLLWVPNPVGHWEVTLTVKGAVKKCIKEDGTNGLMGEITVAITGTGTIGIGAGGTKHPSEPGENGPEVGFDKTNTCEKCEDTLNGSLTLEAGVRAGAIAGIHGGFDVTFAFKDPIRYGYFFGGTLSPYVGAELYFSATGAGSGTLTERSH